MQKELRLLGTIKVSGGPEQTITCAGTMDEARESVGRQVLSRVEEMLEENWDTPHLGIHNLDINIKVGIRVIEEDCPQVLYGAKDCQKCPRYRDMMRQKEQN